MGLVVHYQGGEDRRAWAEQQVQASLDTFEIIAPVESLDSLTPGDVLVSRSGNLRLVLQMFDDGGRNMVHFITRTTGDQVRLEAASVSAASGQQTELVINVKRVAALVRRKDGSPLVQFANLASIVPQNKAAQVNVQTLLLSGPLAQPLRSYLQQNQPVGGSIEVPIWVDETTGQFVTVGQGSAGAAAVEVRIVVDTSGSPASDYIYSAKFLPNTSDMIREFVLGSCVISNTLANIHNLVEAKRTAAA